MPNEKKARELPEQDETRKVTKQEALRLLIQNDPERVADLLKEFLSEGEE